jgi:hypothetical protein
MIDDWLALACSGLNYRPSALSSPSIVSHDLSSPVIAPHRLASPLIVLHRPSSSLHRLVASHSLSQPLISSDRPASLLIVLHRLSPPPVGVASFSVASSHRLSSSLVGSHLSQRLSSLRSLWSPLISFLSSHLRSSSFIVSHHLAWSFSSPLIVLWSYSSPVIILHRLLLPLVFHRFILPLCDLRPPSFVLSYRPSSSYYELTMS